MKTYSYFDEITKNAIAITEEQVFILQYRKYGNPRVHYKVLQPNQGETALKLYYETQLHNHVTFYLYIADKLDYHKGTKLYKRMGTLSPLDKNAVELKPIRARIEYLKRPLINIQSCPVTIVDYYRKGKSKYSSELTRTCNSLLAYLKNLPEADKPKFLEECNRYLQLEIDNSNPVIYDKHLFLSMKERHEMQLDEAYKDLI